MHFFNYLEEIILLFFSVFQRRFVTIIIEQL